MTFKHFAPIGATLALALATPAMAQQDSGKVDWTGPYVGGSFGYNWSKGDGGEHLRFDTDGATEVVAIHDPPPGAEVGMRAPADGDGATPLMVAVKQLSEQLVDTYLEAGARPDAVARDDR